MAKINILDSTIFNLISAGEVVDKPMSVVKELVENSIDAGAKKIEIEIGNGGIDYIKVTDDGYGIERGEIHKAFMPHATSKISCVDDLNSILTLGFRGEALASIAAVAKVTLTSRTEGDELGYAVTYESGKLVGEYEVGCPKGTSITVENIFALIPARHKFLRAPSSEEADISNLILRLILSNPDISFKYVSNNNQKLISTGEGAKSALISAYGNDILGNMDEISLVMPDITIRGYIGKPSFSKHSRNYQTLIVNGRYVKNEDISYMVYLCYKDYLMSRQYPMFVLYIDLPADMVDVNVHPSKMDVKFVQSEKIKKLIKSLVMAKLNNIAVTPKTIESRCDYDAPQKIDPFVSESVAAYEKSEPRYRSTFIPPIRVTPYENNIVKESPSIYSLFKNKKPDAAQSGCLSNNAAKFGDVSGIKESQELTFMGEEEVMTVGTLFSTYIIVEKGESCYLIDQHAAHERILYDKLVKQINDGKPLVQGLLIPYEFELTHDESELLDKNMAIFNECGFEINRQGLKYSVCAVPAIISEMSLKDFIPMFFDAIKLNSLDKASLVKDALAQSACKAAVKGDRLLSIEEINYLIKGVNTLNALLCPHGRPIAIKLTKYEVDKWFKRK